MVGRLASSVLGQRGPARTPAAHHGRPRRTPDVELTCDDLLVCCSCLRFWRLLCASLCAAVLLPAVLSPLSPALYPYISTYYFGWEYHNGHPIPRARAKGDLRGFQQAEAKMFKKTFDTGVPEIIVRTAQSAKESHVEKYALDALERYCTVHGYALHTVEKSGMDKFRGSGWSKFGLMLELLEGGGYDWVAYVAPDVLLLRQDLPMDVFVSLAAPHHHLVSTTECSKDIPDNPAALLGSVQTGLFMVRNSPDGQDMLKHLQFMLDSWTFRMNDRKALKEILRDNRWRSLFFLNSGLGSVPCVECYTDGAFAVRFPDRESMLFAKQWFTSLVGHQ